MSYEKATFGAGCFWGVEADFREIPGVIDTAVGYEGGTLENPTYRDVCTDHTAHAEVVELTFDPVRVSYNTLLDYFWKLHNPTRTRKNREGEDVKTQYRSVIFFHSPEQERLAKASKQAAQAHFSNPIVTEIVPAQPFYRAEDYHQQYLAKRDSRHSHV